jgi:proteasome lid subunit RPN8/RPN11
VKRPYDLPAGSVIYRYGGTARLVEPDEASRSDEGIDFRPDLVDGSFELRISSGARETIRKTLAAVAPHRLETGGYLYSFDRPRYRGAVIDRATYPGPSSRLRSHGVSLSDPEEIEAEFGEFGQRALDNGLRVVGDYHSHPTAAPEPSRDDRKAWARALLDHHFSFYIGVIATRGEGAFGWEFPDLTPWVARGGPKGVEILRARLVD